MKKPTKMAKLVKPPKKVAQAVKVATTRRRIPPALQRARPTLGTTTAATSTPMGKRAQVWAAMQKKYADAFKLKSKKKRS